MPEELPIPDAVQDDAGAVELARVWAAHKSQHVTLATHVWTDPGNWGVMLVDLARHVARAYEQSAGIPPEESLRRVRQAFDAEWEVPTH